NKVDVADPELLTLVELETLELLAQQGYQGSPIVRGSALRALQAAEAGHAGDPAADCIRELVAALDRHIPDPVRDFDAPFLMPVEDVHTIAGRGTVVTGRVQRGTVRRGDRVEIVGLATDGREVVVTDIQAFHRAESEARAGDSVGLLLRGVARDEIARGQIVSAPGAVRPHDAGEAELYGLSAKQGGRHRPVATGSQPHFFFGPADVTGTLEVDGPVEPGARARVTFRLLRPVGVEPGMRFALREGGRTIGAGVVTSVR